MYRRQRAVTLANSLQVANIKLMISQKLTVYNFV